MRARDNMALAALVQQSRIDDDPVDDAADESDDQLVRAAETLGHLGHPTRLHLLRLLAVGEQDVNTLTGQVRASRSSVSQHLGRLRLVGLVHTRRQGRRVLYRIASDHLSGLVEEAHQFAAHLVHDIPHHHPTTPGVDPASPAMDLVHPPPSAPQAFDEVAGGRPSRRTNFREVGLSGS